MALGNKTRALVAITAICLIMYMVQNRDSLSVPRDLPPPQQLHTEQMPNNDAHDEDSPPRQDATNTLLQVDVPPYPSRAELVADAHKLPFADAFLDHFEAVRRLKGLSIKEARQTCSWAADEPVNFQFPSDADWVRRDRSDEEVDLRRREWQTFVEGGMIPWDLVKDKFSGRGLVILSGNQDTVMRAKVILRQLKRLGSEIAVEIHYWEDEISEDSRSELEDMYQPMFFNDLSKGHNIIRTNRDRFWINYQLKTAALLNSRFAEPILLDSDNIPLLDPEKLYDSAVYQEYGTVFWPDITRSRPQNPAWAITNTLCRMDEHEQDSGQLMVDKTRYWYHLQLAAWMNNEQGNYYADFLLGDKDIFRFAWHALKTEYGRPKGWLASVGTVNDGYFCGHSFAQLHPDDGNIVAFMHTRLAKTASPEVIEWNRQNGGFYRSYKHAPADEDPSRVINVGIKFDGATYMPSHSTDFHWAQCADMFDVEPRDLEEIVPGWEAAFEEIGGYWQLDKAREGTASAEQGKETKEEAESGGMGSTAGELRDERDAR